MQPVGNYNKMQWFVYPSHSQESLLTFYFDLVDVRVIKSVQQMRDNVQKCAVSSSKMETVETELFQDTSLYYHFPVMQAGFNCCCLNDM